MTMKRMVLNESVTSVPMALVYLKTSTSQTPKTGNGQQRQANFCFCVGVQTFLITQTKTGLPALILTELNGTTRHEITQTAFFLCE